MLRLDILTCKLDIFTTGSTHSEMLKLQNEKLKAMDVKETLRRLETSLSFVKNNVSMTAAKLAIQSLNMQ
ncbi:hypothetical protein Hanom_Chr02g00108331 [Helianthus anomalus]